MKQKTQRVFIAIPTPTSLQPIYNDIQASFRSCIQPLRWVKTSQLHITLVFLGDVIPLKLDPIRSVMTQAASDTPAFKLHTCALGTFPNKSRPKILWMGLEDSTQTLQHLYYRLTTGLDGIRVHTGKGRSFHPHITLARIRKPARCRQFTSLLSAYQDDSFGDIPVEMLHLFESQLRPTGAVYHILHSAPLQAA